MITYRPLQQEEIAPSLFSGFQRRQVVTHCFRKTKTGWCIQEVPFVDDWQDAQYQELVRCLRNTLQTHGWVQGAFADGALKGFASLEGKLFGTTSTYMDLTSLHVSQEMRGQGIGKTLFCEAKAFAKARGAKKLYLSAHSAVETQAFYQAMGCVDAQEIHKGHAEQEPFDRQLECLL